MKLVSKQCAICQNSIFFQHEGAWCDECKTPFHISCIGHDNCPKCNVEGSIINGNSIETKKEQDTKYPTKYPAIVGIGVAIVMLLGVSFLPKNILDWLVLLGRVVANIILEPLLG